MAAFTFNYHPHPSTNHGPWRVPGSLPAQLSEFLGIRSDSSARGSGCRFGWDSGLSGAMEEPVPKLRRVPTTKMMKERRSDAELFKTE